MTFSLEDPTFRVYAIAAASMALLMATQSWITVYRMTRVSGGYRSPEDAKKSPLNPTPSPEQLLPNEYVERSRRMHLNHCENIPLFLIVGLLFVLAGPPLWAAKLALYGFAVTRVMHFIAYMTAQLHDVRAMMWTPGAIALMSMAGYVLAVAI